DGRMPQMPQLLAGTRTEPPVSVPRAKSTRPQAAADADPLDEPPGTRSGAWGLSGVPKKRFSPRRLKASSSETVLPTQRAPARKSCSTQPAWTTAGGCVSRQVGLPPPVFHPATSIKSLTAKHNPSSNPEPVGDTSKVATKALLWATVIVEAFILTGSGAGRVMP